MHVKALWSDATGVELSVLHLDDKVDMAIISLWIIQRFSQSMAVSSDQA